MQVSLTIFPESFLVIYAKRVMYLWISTFPVWSRLETSSKFSSTSTLRLYRRGSASVDETDVSYLKTRSVSSVC